LHLGGLREARWQAELYFRKIFMGELTSGNLMFRPVLRAALFQAVHISLAAALFAMRAPLWWSAKCQTLCIPTLQDCERSGSDHKIIEVFVRYAGAV